jgi:RNA polymerase sigma factor (sigma-70 family)
MADPLNEAEARRAGEVFAEHRGFVESVARRHASLPADVPDIVQDVGMRICTGLNGFRGEAELRSWLYRVTVNAARDRYRTDRWQIERPREEVAVVQGGEAYDGDLMGHVRRRERAKALHEGIEHLRTERTREGIRDELITGSVLLNRKTRWGALKRLRGILADDPRIHGGGEGDGTD